jgi:hypothetical protein
MAEWWRNTSEAWGYLTGIRSTTFYDRLWALPVAALARLARRAGYFDSDFAPGLGASACGLRKVELTGASFLLAFGFLASRLPRCLLPLPMIVHPMVVLPAAMY